MQKKLIAAAVAGALGIPAVALAQNATVNVSGRVYLEYGSVQSGSQRAGLAVSDIVNPDTIQTPGSNITFQGEEKLGGGLSAWFRCETSMDVRGTASTDSLCQRNSGLGFRGGFGNVFAGNWHTPFALARITTGGNETGHFGTATLLTGHSTTIADGSTAGLFARRQNNLISYHTPSISGFQGMLAYSAVNAQTATQDAVVNKKPRLWSLAATYKNGPLNLSAAYERHNDSYVNGTGGATGTTAIGTTAATQAGDETGWLLGASYRFANKVTFGGMYTRQKAEVAGLNSRVNAWQLGVDWSLGGPHSIKAAYTNAGDHKGTSTVLQRRPAVVATNDNGAQMYQARYFYAFSKRTDFSVGFNHLKNEDNAGYRINALGGSGAGGQLGAKHTAYAMAIDHRF